MAAKKDTTATEETTTAVATTGNAIDQFAATNVPANLEEDAGLGNENVTQSDLVIPRIKLLQALSPEATASKPEFIPGAKAGQYINTNTKELAEELYVLNILFSKSNVVFKKRKFNTGNPYRGSFETTAEAQAEIDRIVNDPNNEGEMSQMFEIVPTHRHTLMRINTTTGKLEPIVMDWSSTKLTASSQWNTAIANQGGARFATIWKLTTETRSNSSGDWFSPVAVFVGYANDDLRGKAKEFYGQLTEALEAGNVDYQGE